MFDQLDIDELGRTDPTRTKEKHTLGSVASSVEAATYRAFAEAEVYADGHGEVLVRRDGEVLHRFAFGPEQVA
jgi:hypothetical protein